VIDPVDWARIRRFGQRTPGVTYVARPGAYAVIFDSRGRIAVIQTPRGHFLPGGGAEPDESAEVALTREVAEETGRQIVIRRRLGEAVEFVFAEKEGYFEKRCVFFAGTFGADTGAALEADHILLWLEPAAAAARMGHASQNWAVRQATASTANPQTNSRPG